MKKMFSLLFVVLLPLPFWLVNPTAAQSAPFERRFQNPKTAVDKAVQELCASTSGRLPVLEGFVQTTDQSLDHYERGYYQCVAQVASDTSGGTLVRVTAKITAWYADPNPARAGYRILPSNGRLEMDLLDRLEEVLARETPGSASAPQPAPGPRPTPTPRAEPNTATAPAANKSAAIRIPASVVPAAPADVAAQTLAPNVQDLRPLKQRREEAERHMKQLSSELQNLEELLHNQAHPNDLAIVRKSGTPVMAKPQANAPVLFTADREDEFQILDKEGAWVHVQVSGASRGWIRRAQLDLPEGLADSAKKAGASGPTDEPPFRVTREETNAFAGAWVPLHGKTVRIIWVEPTSTSGKPSSPRAKRDFVKSLFLKAYREVSSTDQTVLGVVVVFNSADGGQIAATLASVKQWQGGSLSEASFWQQCSLDPPEAFQDSDKS